jgi:hypothetical protein
MKFPRVSSNTRLQATLALLSAVVEVDHVRTVGEHLEVKLRPLPRGFVALMRTKLLGRTG